MGYTILQPIDTKRYTPMEGLEGPFMQTSGKVLYYDPAEGKYYDRDTDMYLEHNEGESHQ